MFEKVNVPILGVIENMAYFLAPDTRQEILYSLVNKKRGRFPSVLALRPWLKFPSSEDLLGYDMNAYRQQCICQTGGWTSCLKQLTKKIQNHPNRN